MSRRVALVTGAAGEMGHLLIPSLIERGFAIVTVDQRPLPDELAEQCIDSVDASILDETAMRELFARHDFSQVYHLAAILSTKAEREPRLAHRVNVDGTFGLFDLCRTVGATGGVSPTFLFPSSIAVYGLPDAAAKTAAGRVREHEWLVPTGMYGCNKLYCELFGSHLSRDRNAPPLDFRSIRFPGLISADTLPSGGTTDYGPEMLHAAAQGKPYTCFVREDSRLPFMTMPDAVDAMLKLAEAPADRLTTRVYNIGAFSVTAGDLRDQAVAIFPDAQIDFEPVAMRQAIVDSWPADVDDSRARADWGLAPRHGFPGALTDYLAPALKTRYAARSRVDG